MLSHLNTLTPRFPPFPLRSLCSLATLAVSPLVFAATHKAFCCTPISLKLAYYRILHAAPAVIRPRTPLISPCVVQLRTLCAACSLANLFSLRPLVQALGSCAVLGFHGLPPCFRPLEGVGNNNSNSNMVKHEFISFNPKDNLREFLYLIAVLSM